MKNILFTLMFTMAFMAGFSQLYNSGGAITVQPGATLVIEGNYTCDNSATIDIDGNVELKGHLINNGGTILPAGAGTLKFNGTAAQEIKGGTGTTFNCAVEINNTQGVSLQSADAILAAALTFTNGKLTLNAYDLTLAAAGVTGAGAGKYIVTNNSNGEVKATVAASNVLFPVGNSAYNPVILNNTSTSDVFGVRVVDGTPSSWTEHAVNRTWVVTGGTGGGFNLAVTPQWATADQLTNMDITDCAVGLTVNSGTSYTWTASGAASGSNPTITRTGSGFNTVGSFVVGDYFFEGIELDLDLFLAGPYSGGAMTTALKTAGLIPLIDPYGNMPNVSSIPANTVDWIEVELRTAPAASPTKSYSFFLKNDGNVMNVDGTDGAKLTGVAKASYYVAVKHRNHLGAMTANPINFTAAGPYSFNFTTGTTGVYGTNPMRGMNAGAAPFALWAGDINGDNQIIYQGAGNDVNLIANYISGLGGGPSAIGTNVYEEEDVNMDGNVIYQGAGNDPTPVGNSISNHPGYTGVPTYAVTGQIP